MLDTKTRDRTFVVFVAATIVVGGAVIAAVLTGADWIGKIRDDTTAFVLLTLLLIAGEVRPVGILRLPKLTEEPPAPSTTFVYALLLVFGAPVTLVAHVCASIIDDTIHRRAPYKILFNVAQYGISMALADAVLAIGERPFADGHFDLSDLPIAAASAAVYFLANNALVGTFLALRSDKSVPRMLIDVIRDEAPMETLLLCLAPLAAIVAVASPVLLPLLLLPSLTIYVSSRSVLEMERRGLTDALTELPNRQGVKSDLDDRFTRNGAVGAIALLDLDRFQYVNDTLGHQVGDQLLIEVATRLRTEAGAELVGRMGGDEFVVYSSSARSPEDAEGVARSALAALSRPFAVDELDLSIEASAGVAMAPTHGRSADELLQRADTALYVAKSSADQVSVYDSGRDQHSRRRLRLLGEMRSAIAEGQLVLHFQPQADLSSGEIIGLEALVRWQHPELGLIMPDEFVPLAEHSTLIQPLTRWVLQAAIAEARRQLDAKRYLTVAVNLSSRALHDRDLPVDLADELRKHRVGPGSLTLEVTESAVADLGPASKILTTIATMGVGVAIDDFGTGYSSLTYLKQLPVTEIKIDRSFVVGLGGDAHDDAIVAATIELARSLKLTTVAEGVESDAVARALRQLGCSRMQGYLLSAPLPADELDAWLSRTVDVDDQVDVDHRL